MSGGSVGGLQWLLRWVVEPRAGRFAVLLIFLSLTSVGLYHGLFAHLPRSSSLNRAPERSPSYLAMTKLFHYFPAEAVGQQFATQIVIHSPPAAAAGNSSSCDVLLDDRVVQFELALESLLRYQFPTEKDMFYASHRKYKAMGLDYFANKLVVVANGHVGRNTTQVIQLTIFKPLKSPTSNFADYIDDTIALLATTHLRNRGVFVASTGPQVFSRDLKHASEGDALKIHLATLPLSLLVLAWTFRSLRLLLLPILMFTSSMAISTLALGATGMHITSLVPSIMTASSVGQSVDASLFLLSRFREELKRGAAVELAVEQSFVYAGHTVLVSGCTLAFCWFILVLFPVDVIHSVGLAVGINTIVCLTVNLLLTPAMLLTFPHFFSSTESFFSPQACCCRRRGRSSSSSSSSSGGGGREEATPGGTWWQWCCCCCNCCGTALSAVINDNDDDDEIGPDGVNGTSGEVNPVCNNNHNNNGDNEEKQQDLDDDEDDATCALADTDLLMLPLMHISTENQVSSELQYLERNAKRTFKLARFVTRNKPTALAIVIVLSVFLILPFAALAMTFSRSNSTKLLIPRDYPGTAALDVIEREFSGGMLNPYHLLIIDKSVPQLRRAQYFEYLQEAVIEPLAKSGVASVESVLFTNNRRVPYKELELCLAGRKRTTTASCRAINYLAKRTISSFDTLEAIMVQIELPFDPNSERGHAWLQSTRAFLDTVPGVELHLASGAAAAVDVIEAVFQVFPACVILTCGVILVAIALAFKSLVVPIRAMFSIFTTLCVVYGGAVLVYKHQALQFIGLAGLQSPTGEIIWVAPIMLFGVLCGISLDYDTFTLTRIVEYKSAGFSDTDAVRAGLASSFKVVSTAGLIMTISFGGLFFSSVPVLNQVAFFLVTAVLFDTFVVRILFVPSLMILLGRFNWFPRTSVQRWETQS